MNASPIISYLVCVLMPAQPLQDSPRGPRGELYIRKPAPTPPKLSKPLKDPAGSRRESSWIESWSSTNRRRGARARSRRAARVGRTVSAFSDFLGRGREIIFCHNRVLFGGKSESWVIESSISNQTFLSLQICPFSISRTF